MFEIPPLLKDLPQPLRAMLPARFWAKVEQRDACWCWTGAHGHRGHGLIWQDGKNTRATHVIWDAFRGGRAPSGWVLHECDHPPRVFPGHLSLGDHQANVDDMVRKGRQHRPIGDRHHNRLLSEESVRSIKTQIGAGAIGAEVARAFGVHPNTVYAIKAGKLWGHVC